MINGLPEKLAALRTKRGLSQRDVATRLSWSPSIISGYELGTRTPSADNLLVLARFYRCTADYLLGLDHPTPTATLDVSDLTEEQIMALKALVESIKA